MPANIDSLKNMINIANTRKVKIYARINDLLKLWFLKNTTVQDRLMKNWSINTASPKTLVVDWGVYNIKINEIPINIKSIDQTYLKTDFGGWKSGFFRFSKKLSS